MRVLGLLLFSVFLTAATGYAFADETMSEKVSASADTAKRGMKKGAHRVSEALCTKGDVSCAAEKVVNRAEEVKDATVDGAVKVKNKMD